MVARSLEVFCWIKIGCIHSPLFFGQVATDLPGKERTFYFPLELKKKTIEDLKIIMEKDYGVSLSDEEAQKYGLSYLRLTRLAVSIVVKAEGMDRKSN